MSINFKPADGRVLVERSTTEKTDGGIFIPTAAQEKSDTGVIKVTGQGKVLKNGERAAMNYKEGDRVLFGKYAGTDVNIQNKDYVIVNVKDIMGVFA